MNTNTGGPAFPGPYANENGSIEALFKQQGMTLRDYFAAKALQGLLAAYVKGVPPAGLTAHAAYSYADAMLEARKS